MYAPRHAGASHRGHITDEWAERTWRPHGARGPYFAVCNEDGYRRDRLDATARAAFFDTGRVHVAWVGRLIAERLGGTFRPARVLDFGCGVGRVLLPLAEGTERAVGVDVAPEMLAEAAANAAAFGLG